MTGECKHGKTWNCAECDQLKRENCQPDADWPRTDAELIAEGEQNILREVATLPSPVVGSWGPGEPIPNGCGPCVRITICEWCGGRGPHHGPVEHRNGCLWPRAMQAKEGKK